MKLCIKSADRLAKKDFFGLRYVYMPWDKMCYGSYSDPYVKIMIKGEEMQVYPHFISLDDDEFPQVYKTSVISKVVT